MLGTDKPHDPTPNSSANGRLAAAPDPIAIIGLGCRFPGGADSWQSYWHMLESGTDAISQTPADRWSLQKFYAKGMAMPGKTQSKWGGYVRGIDQFDPQLFGISPREAASMDPQQRMLLEVAFRAMEDAGQPVEKLAAQPVAVFVGISSFDYAVAGLSFQDRGVIDAYSNTGGSSSIAANRISYCFDLRGPSVAVDTACSSSLVALHMACESIWRGEASMALAGGVNALLLPDFYIAFSQLGVLSPDGRCKTFDQSANGYVRSEGAGMVLLKPLADALRDKDLVYAVVRATALNQDGRTPGMTVPSQAAQEALIRTACKKAQVRPCDIQYVEAHGTGTPVGDPIEANALGAVLGEGRNPDAGRCWIGSVKTNIGHLEAGAGIASVIKVALALHHARIPAHLHFRQANPAIDFAALKLQVPTVSQDWPASDTPRLAGINGFGYGGANAHIILEQAPVSSNCGVAYEGSQVNRALVKNTASSALEARSPGVVDSASNPTKALAAPVLLPLSARSKPALASLANSMADWLELHGPEYHLAEVAGYLAHRRSHQDYRTTASANNATDMIRELRALAASRPEEYIEEFSPNKRAKGIAFVCSGQGPQWWAMGRGLLRYSPAFRSVIKRCDAEFSKHGDWSLMQELTRSESTSRMQKTRIAQPSIFAIQVALAAVWESWGIKPSVLVGHSVGEIAAAYLSGALDWEDACCVAFHRGRTMDLASSQGAMLAAGLSADEVPSWLEGIEHLVSLAAINGPTSVSISGDAPAIDGLATRLEKAGVFCRRLAVEYAFHSPQMDPVRTELLRSLAYIRPRPTHTSLVSTVSGKLIEGSELGAEYWWQNVRQSVRFSDAMKCLADQSLGVVVEIGPHPVLAYSINECFQAADSSVRSVPSLNRQQDDLSCITKSLGSLFSLGFGIRWAGFYNQPARRIPLPNYPFQLQKCWSESWESRITRLAETAHPLLGESLHGPSSQWQQRIDLKTLNYLADHQVRGACVYPAAAMIETCLAAAIQMPTSHGMARLERLQLLKPCVLAHERPQCIQAAYDVGRRQLELAFRDCDENEWTRMASVGISLAAPIDAGPIEAAYQSLRSSLDARCTQEFGGARLYEYCQAIGLTYGDNFRGVVRGRRTDGEALVEISCAQLGDLGSEADEYYFHPALLDSCFHAMLAADPNFDHTIDGLYLPVSIGEITYYRKPSSDLTVHARVLTKTSKLLVCDLDVFDASGQLCISLRNFQSQRVSGGRTLESTEDLLYSYSWVQDARPLSKPMEPGNPAQWLLFMDEAGAGRELSHRLRSRGDLVLEVYREHSRVAQAVDSTFFQVDPESRDSFGAMLSSVRAEVSSLDAVVYLWGLDVPPTDQLTTATLEQSTQLTTLAPMNLVQAWEQHLDWQNVNLVMVTSGAQSQDGLPEPTQVGQSPLVGFGRVIVSEFSGLRGKLVDLPTRISAHDLDCLAAELLADDDEDEILWRSGCRYVHRFLPQTGKQVSPLAARRLPCQLRLGASASIDELRYETKPVFELKAGEVEIEVLASGLNFSDVMKALDLYPGLPQGPVDLGAECSGRISRVGPSGQWKVGDEVMAVAPGSFGSHVTVNSALVARKPTNLTFEQAAAIPIAFLTADYALHQCARLRAGDSVLIHAASGGVGLAAMQLARLAGVTILATAGNDEKRQFVREQGARHVMDSRSLAFADETLHATQGVGVDAVLNSLPGEAIAKGLSVLKTGGRFLEIGKRDIYGDSAIGLYAFRNNLAMFAIDLDQLFQQQPERMGQMLGDIVDRIESGQLHALPVSAYTSNETVAAYRFMQQGKHIGKVVVTYDEKPDAIQAGTYAPIRFNADATYWLAGGLGGFGLQIARWMIQSGARTLVLTGRSKVLKAEAAAAIEDFRTCGARVTVLPADITRAEDVRRVLATIDRELPPLRGVLHTAMVLEDKLLVDLDRDTLERVLRPKVLGGWNLHQETLGRELDLFVLFSSLSSVFGHAGQANYSAANALLDSLAYYRRAQGLPATVMNWGHLGEVGYLAERAELGARLERQGVLSFSVQQACDSLEYALQTHALQLSVLRIDWSLWRGLGITQRVSPRFAHLLRQQTTAGESGDALPSAERLRAVTGIQREQQVERLLRSKASVLLGIAADQIQAERALLEMGLDSLMAVEMRNWIENHMEINLPISALMRSESLRHLVLLICETIDDSDLQIQRPDAATTIRDESRQSSISNQQAEALLEQLPSLGDDDVSALLNQLLREQK